MTIVDRLNKFLETNNISKSQFADSCEIPRPTVSQILGGRNKKISDDIIGKIHKIYPSLSITWLMFGEGEMELEGTAFKPSEKSIFDANPDFIPEFPNLNTSSHNVEHIHSKQKKIRKIVVFYTDNSFEEYHQV